MFPYIPRNFVQFISLFLFGAGAIVIVAGGWEDTMSRAIGICLMAGSIWFVMMSESVFLGKVQAQMHQVLDTLSAKREAEIQELLDFLKGSKLASTPMDSWDGVKAMVTTLPYPAFLLSPSMEIIKTNDHMTDLLGYEQNALNGKPVYLINDITLLSHTANVARREEYIDKEHLSMRYMYMHKDGSGVVGSLHVIKVIDGAFFMVFHPDTNNMITDNDLNRILTRKNVAP